MHTVLRCSLVPQCCVLRTPERLEPKKQLWQSSKVSGHIPSPVCNVNVGRAGRVPKVDQHEGPASKRIWRAMAGKDNDIWSVHEMRDGSTLFVFDEEISLGLAAAEKAAAPSPSQPSGELAAAVAAPPELPVRMHTNQDGTLEHLQSNFQKPSPIPSSTSLNKTTAIKDAPVPAPAPASASAVTPAPSVVPTETGPARPPGTFTKRSPIPKPHLPSPSSPPAVPSSPTEASFDDAALPPPVVRSFPRPASQYAKRPLLPALTVLRAAPSPPPPTPPPPPPPAPATPPPSTVSNSIYLDASPPSPTPQQPGGPAAAAGSGGTTPGGPAGARVAAAAAAATDGARAAARLPSQFMRPKLAPPGPLRVPAPQLKSRFVRHQIMEPTGLRGPPAEVAVPSPSTSTSTSGPDGMSDAEAPSDGKGGRKRAPSGRRRSTSKGKSVVVNSEPEEVLLASADEHVEEVVATATVSASSSGTDSVNGQGTQSRAEAAVVVPLLEDMKVDDLRALAKEKGVKGSWKMRKAELQAAILGAESSLGVANE